VLNVDEDIRGEEVNASSVLNDKPETADIEWRRSDDIAPPRSFDGHRH
jgi:hypothetical protein